MAWHRLSVLAGGFLAAASVVVLAWGMWPAQLRSEALLVGLAGTSVPATGAESDSSASQAAKLPTASRLVTLRYPAAIRAGDSELVSLRLEDKPTAGAGRSTDTVDAQHAGGRLEREAGDSDSVFAEARLELPGAEVRPSAEITAPLVPGHAIDFVWSVRISEPEAVRGTAWLFLVTARKGSQTENRVAVSAQSLDLRMLRLVGLSGRAARVGGSLTLIASMVLVASAIGQARNRP